MENDDDDEPPVDFDSIAGFIFELLRIIQLMCEGHNQKMKSYVSKQPDNIKSINLVRARKVCTVGLTLGPRGGVAQVEKAVEYLHVVYLNIDGDSIELVQQNLETLIEVTSGHPDNQVVVFDSKGVDIINHLLRLDNFPGCDADDVIALKRSTVLLAETLLEENSAFSARLAKDVRGSHGLLGADADALLAQLYAVLDLEAVRRIMFDERYMPSAATEGEDDPAEIGFLCYRVLLRFRDFNVRSARPGGGRERVVR